MLRYVCLHVRAQMDDSFIRISKNIGFVMNPKDITAIFISAKVKVLRSCHLISSDILVYLAQHSLIQFQKPIHMLESSRGSSLSLSSPVHILYTNFPLVRVYMTDILQLEGPNLNCKLLVLLQQTFVSSKKETINCMKTLP